MRGRFEWVIGVAFVLFSLLGAWCFAAAIATWGGVPYPGAAWVGFAGPALLLAGLGLSGG